MSRALRRGAVLVVVLATLACGGAEDWQGRGEVRRVMADEAQVVIAHEAIEDLMPAMTMSFDVADPTLLHGIRPGQRVTFRLVKRGGIYEITELAPEGDVVAGVAGVSGGNLAEVRDPAPDFSLVDQDGRALALEDLRGKAVLLDFIFTRCPGPCPILTGTHVEVQRALEEELRERVHFVSVSLDPEHDVPAVLGRYAERLGIDTRSWSLVTGEPEDVARVAGAYGVGTLRQPDGEIEHTVATFLIDPQGRIVRRYLGLRHEPAAIADDIERLL